MSWFRKDPPPPPEKPFYRKNPMATAAVFLTFVAMFVLGPVGAVYKGMTEELKEKANNETLLMYMKQQEERDAQQWKMIDRELTKQKTINIDNSQMDTSGRRAPAYEPRRATVPDGGYYSRGQDVVQQQQQQQSIPPPALTPKEFNDYMDMTPERRASFRKLHPAYANLPE